MHLDCPHCGTQMDIMYPATDGGTSVGTEQRLRGGDVTCEECENALGIYYL